MVKHYFVFLILTVFLFSCKSDEDKNNPEIIIQNIEWGSGSFNEQDTLVVQAGEQITLSALLQDDQELNSFKLELDAVSIDEIHQDETSWSERRIKSLSGTSEVFESILNTPIQADGFFTLDLNLIDDQGNSATPVDYIINVENIEFPTIQIDSLNGLVPTNTIQLLQGETLIIKGNASDNTNFEELSLNWLFGDVIFTSNVHAVNTNELWLEDYEFTAPIDLLGEVDFYLSFRDSDQNVKNCTFKATISE